MTKLEKLCRESLVDLYDELNFDYLAVPPAELIRSLKVCRLMAGTLLYEMGAYEDAGSTLGAAPVRAAAHTVSDRALPCLLRD